jgi:hypothetical protein
LYRTSVGSVGIERYIEKVRYRAGQIKGFKLSFNKSGQTYFPPKHSIIYLFYKSLKETEEKMEALAKDIQISAQFNPFIKIDSNELNNLISQLTNKNRLISSNPFYQLISTIFSGQNKNTKDTNVNNDNNININTNTNYTDDIEPIYNNNNNKDDNKEKDNLDIFSIFD